MKQVYQNVRTGVLAVEDIPLPALKSGAVLVRNLYSAISPGTERRTVKAAKQSLIGKARSRPDLVRAVLNTARREGAIDTIRRVKNRLDTPVALGYSSAGAVIEVASDVSEFSIGDRVACAGAGYASHAEVVCVPRNLCALVPEGVDLSEAAFTTVGAIALHGMRIAEIGIAENVAVIGLGLVGLLTVQLLKAAGCRVTGIDIDEFRLGLARDLGADEVRPAAALKSGEIERIKRNLTAGNGFDAVIIAAATKSDEPLALAGELARDRGKVVVVGSVGMNLPRKQYYEKELRLVVSRSYGPGRYDPSYEEQGMDYPIGYVRWTEKRNMESFLQLVAEGKVNVKKLITHRFKIDHAIQAYDVITGKTAGPSLGVLLEYDASIEDKRIFRTVTVKAGAANLPAAQVNAGFIGAGNFARASLLPLLSKMKSVRLVSVCTASGLSAKATAQRFGFHRCTTSDLDILDDSSINAVFIATRHGLHAKLVMEALKRSKYVFVEKPLCLSESELAEIAACMKDDSSAILAVGFNRRFSPYAVYAKEHFADRKRPMMIQYRVNAGFIPGSHWVHDPVEGGGRIVGEVCHFIDLATFMTGSLPIRVYAEALPSGTMDDVSINLTYADGSIVSILYTASGDNSLPKEKVEIFNEGRIAIIDDFNGLMTSKDNKSKATKRGKDKGLKAEMVAFVKSIGSGVPPITFEEIRSTTLTTFKILESIQKGTPVDIA
jgi:predicted dehydrogenase/threonine dehydrogenase-like Zn-dependent dehydrogenase